MEDKNCVEMISERLDSMENILKMLVINSLLDDLNYVDKKEREEAPKTLSEKLKKILEEHGMSYNNLECIQGFTLLYINCESFEKYKMKDYRVVNIKIRKMGIKIIPVFKFEALNEMQRKKLFEVNLSFCINEKELYIQGRSI